MAKSLNNFQEPAKPENTGFVGSFFTFWYYFGTKNCFAESVNSFRIFYAGNIPVSYVKTQSSKQQKQEISACGRESGMGPGDFPLEVVICTDYSV